MLRKLLRRRTAVENHDLPCSHELGCCATDGDLAVGGDLLPNREIADGGRGGQGATVHALELSFRSELAQVATNRVLRQLELFADLLRDDFALFFQNLQQEGLALFREHTR